MMNFPTLRHFVRHVAITGLLASSTFMLAAPADAQTVMRPNVEGAVLENQAPPQPQPRRPLREGVTGFAISQEPRFKVEAVRFKAVNESHGTSAGSDEVVGVFFGPQHRMTTVEYENVDTGESRDFGVQHNCIWPSQDTGTVRDRAWACAPEGAAGPVAFSIVLLEMDWDHPYHGIWPFGELCHSNDLAPVATNSCEVDQGDELFRGAFSYDVAQILSRLDPACRCFEETASQSHGDDTQYEVTFRITRVDTYSEPLAVDPNAGSPVDPPAPIVHSSGSLTAPLMQGFELDAGVIAPAGDFAFSRGAAAYLLTPNGGAKIWLGGATARGYAACYAQRASPVYVTTAVVVPAVGQHACYVTSDGRVGELSITSVPAGTLSIAYTTWQ